MLKNKLFLVIGLIIVSGGLILSIFGCSKMSKSSKGQKEFGAKIVDSQNVTVISDILKDSEAYKDKTVVVIGKITAECSTGCWFDVNSENNSPIRVDVKPNGFAIPQVVGKMVVVEGKVEVKDGNVEIIGSGVKIK